MVSAKLLLTPCIWNSFTPLKLVSFTVLTTSGFSHLWPSQGYHFLTLFSAFPSQKWALLLQHPARFRTCSFLSPSFSLMWANSITLMPTAHTLSFSKMKLVLNFAKVQNVHSVITKAELSLCSSSSLETSAIYNFFPQQIMPSGHCFTAEHQQKFVLTLSEPFWTDPNCAVSTLQVTKHQEEEHLLMTMKSSTKLFPNDLYDNHIPPPGFCQILGIFFPYSFHHLSKPLHLTGFGDSGTTEGFFSPFMCKRCNCSCSPTFCLLRIQITIFQLTVLAFKLSGFYRQHYTYICHLFSSLTKNRPLMSLC